MYGMYTYEKNNNRMPHTQVQAKTIIGIDKLVIYNIHVHIDDYKFADINI